MQYLRKSICLVFTLVWFQTITVAKRHSHVNKIERYEKRAQAAAQAQSSLAAALSKQTKHMSYDEALLAQGYYRTAQEQDMVIKTGERILAVGGNQTIKGVQEVLRKTRLELAELALNKRKFDDAERHAQDYLLFYPGSAECKKALFISLCAAYRSQSHSHRDQQKTHATIEHAASYLAKYPQDTEFRSQVDAMRHESYLKLIRSELNIIETQLHAARNSASRESLLAADKRLLAIKENLLTHAPETRKRVLKTEQEIAQQLGSQERIQTLHQELASLSHAVQPTVQPYWKDRRKKRNYFYEDHAEFFAEPT